ncbi:MAG: hypothetical protein NW204_09925 [Xanthomonadaceae bacterium]|nr:hypothetical protein [Xanthomonadaceae bacterium]
MRTITSSLTRVSAALAVGFGLAAGAYAQHPQSQPKPALDAILVAPIPGGWRVETAEGMFPPGNNVTNPPGTNFLETVYENYRLPDGTELPNTLPSTPDGKYNLHDGPVKVKKIRRESPIEDLLAQIVAIEKVAASGPGQGPPPGPGGVIPLNKAIDNAIDIIEGNPLSPAYLKDRAYEGMPLLHYIGPLKNKVVQPIFDPDTGQKIGGNVDVNMVYYGEFIESDTSMIDPSQVLQVPFTITYHVNILQNGIEDFAPFVMYFDSPAEADEFLPIRARSAGVAMDQSFFPMLKEGTRYTIKIKQAPGSHWSLVYNWGWRIHPPRVQVIENSTKIFPINSQLQPARITLLQMEQEVFGVNPRQNQAAKEAAIAKIGDLAPPKRMWNILRALKGHVQGNHFSNPAAVAPMIADLREAYLQWLTRRKLPSGVTADPDSQLTMLYVNNTIYGEMPANVSGQGSGLGPESFKGASSFSLFDWETRPFEYKATVLNGDHFYHAYVNVDFGGWRGWENQFQFTDPTTVIDEDTGEPIFPIDRGGTDEHLEASPRNPDINGDPQLGSGCFFTFGRVHFWVNAGPPVGSPTFVPPVQADGTPSRMNIEVKMNFEPTMRLKVYQFDPFHHDVAVFSLH